MVFELGLEIETEQKNSSTLEHLENRTQGEFQVQSRLIPSISD